MMKLRKNIGFSGRILRFAIALFLLMYAAWFHSWLAFAGALFVIFEAWMSWCVVYQLMGWNSCPVPKDKGKE
jgi:hypothetical protein